jgi:hypothetical protein
LIRVTACPENQLPVAASAIVVMPVSIAFRITELSGV